jgi:hypothetical protein
LDRALLEALARVQALDNELTSSWAYARTLDEQVAATQVADRGPAMQLSKSSLWDAEVALGHDERFAAAYAAGLRAGHMVEHPGGRADERSVEWRTRIVCWAAQHAARLDGAFVECRFDVGLYALAACQYVELNTLDRDFYLFDMVTGASSDGLSYPACCQLLERNLAAYPRTHLIRGTVPDTLHQAHVDRVSYFSLDVRVAEPSLGVLAWFWPKLVSCAVVVLEGYGWPRYASWRDLVDAFAREQRLAILPLPTGQGLIVKP